MIINIKNKKDIITLDFRIRQLRYLMNEEDRKIFFIHLSINEANCLRFLFREDRVSFFSFTKHMVKDSIGIEMNREDLKIMKN